MDADPFDPEALASFILQARVRWGLTPKESEVVYHQCRGVTSQRELTQLLDVVTNTLKGHVTRIFKRMHVNNWSTVVMVSWPLYTRCQKYSGP